VEAPLVVVRTCPFVAVCRGVSHRPPNALSWAQEKAAADASEAASTAAAEREREAERIRREMKGFEVRTRSSVGSRMLHPVHPCHL
jgi:hypothetical protein